MTAMSIAQEIQSDSFAALRTTNVTQLNRIQLFRESPVGVSFAQPYRTKEFTALRSTTIHITYVNKPKHKHDCNIDRQRNPKRQLRGIAFNQCDTAQPYSESPLEHPSHSHNHSEQDNSRPCARKVHGHSNRTVHGIRKQGDDSTASIKNSVTMQGDASRRGGTGSILSPHKSRFARLRRPSSSTSRNRAGLTTLFFAQTPVFRAVLLVYILTTSTRLDTRLSRKVANW